MSLNPVTITRLEKAAMDNGFDLERGSDGNWLIFGSSHASLQIWLTMFNESLYHVAFSRAIVSNTLATMGEASTTPIPKGAEAVLGACDLPGLNRLVRRAFQLARALPDEPLNAFNKKTAGLPRTTEAEQLIIRRIGQDTFREALMDYWGGACAVTGINVPEVLRASHAKPWADCDNDKQRLDVFNGFLLCANLDALFDRGLISFTDTGKLIISDRLETRHRSALHLSDNMALRWVAAEHAPYLNWHRQHVFQRLATLTIR